jgi:antitoxin MazE
MFADTEVDTLDLRIPRIRPALLDRVVAALPALGEGFGERTGQDVGADIRNKQYVAGQEVAMQVSRWGNSLALRLAAAVVEALNPGEGDDIIIEVAYPRHFRSVHDRGRGEALDALRSLGWSLRGGIRFDRDVAKTRGAIPPFRHERAALRRLAADPCLEVARARLARRGTTSAQVLNESANVSARMLRPPWPETSPPSARSAPRRCHSLWRSVSPASRSPDTRRLPVLRCPDHSDRSRSSVRHALVRGPPRRPEAA